MSLRIFNSQKIVISSEFGDVFNYTNSSSIVTIHNVYNIINFHIIHFSNSVIFEVQFNSIIHLYGRIDISKSSSVMSYIVTYFVWSNSFLLDSAKFESSFFLFKFNQNKSTFRIVKYSVSLSKFRDINYVHKTQRKFRISSYFLIDMNKTFSSVKDGINLGRV